VISFIGFYFNIYQKNNKVFITSLYKINYIFNKREKKPTEETDEELVKRLFFSIYLKYKNIYLKAVLNKLLFYQIYNYKIQLETNNSLGFSPFY